MDIQSGKPYPAGALSNFAPHPFVFRGVPCNSMEGLLQSLKFKSPDMQKVVCLMVGKAAKFKGKNKPWWREQKLYWQGQEIDRHSQKYQDLLDEAFTALFNGNQKAKAALLATGEAVLTHNIGKSDASHTILTRSEFCGRLTRIRTQLNAHR